MKNLATAIATSGHLIEQNKQGLSVEDVFSTYVYTGTGAAQSIVNGIDLATEGGMVWIKCRNLGVVNYLFDTKRIANQFLVSSSTQAGNTNADVEVEPYTTTGFNPTGTNNYVNGSGNDYVSWTFRKAPRFFDVVKYTGNGVAGREIAHELGVAPGMIIVKKLTTTTGDWEVYHKSLGGTHFLRLNTTSQAYASAGIWNDTDPTDTVFTVADGTSVNGDATEYIAYLFAHDPDGPSGDGSDGLIACGEILADGSGNANIDLGWEPQYLLTKRVDIADSWYIVDNMRGAPTGGNTAYLLAESSQKEYSFFNYIDFTATGFDFIGGGSNGTYIYMAIRRPMRTPKSSDEVFEASLYAGSDTAQFIETGINADMILGARVTGGAVAYIYDKLRGKDSFLLSSSAQAEALATSTADIVNWSNHGLDLGTSYTGAFAGSGSNKSVLSFKRAKGFFDVVAYTGDGISGRTVAHNLGVVPEMIWVKKRDATSPWVVYHKANPSDYFYLNGTNAKDGLGDTWPATATELTINTALNNFSINTSTANYVLYAFATLAGISKVGSYTGNGGNQMINCDFSTGARFVMIKRTDSTGDWYMWDTVRGIVTGNDPHLSLNTTAAEVTSDDSIDPDSTGFIVNQNVATNINVNAGEYIYYAIA